MATSTPTNLDNEINEGILRTYLGVEDASDIDFETYRTLLKEKIAAARMGGSKMDSGDISYLTNEFLRIKKFKVPEGKKKKKIDVKKFVKKTEETRKKSERLNNKFLDSQFSEEAPQERKIKELHYSNDDQKKEKIKLLSKMKVDEIINICIKLEIEIINKLTLKKKTKAVLIEEIKKCM